MENNSEKYPIRRSWVLSIFFIIPVVFSIGMYDVVLNDMQWRQYFGVMSLWLPLYLIIFELPHIFASFLSFLDKEYVKHYRTHLLLGIPLLLVAFISLALWQFTVAVVVYLAVTVYHVIRQQTGIALMFGIPKGNEHFVWSWSLIFGSALMYVLLFGQAGLASSISDTAFRVAQAFLILSGIAGLLLMRKSNSWQAYVYILATMAMTIASYSLLVFGYVFLSIFIIRFIHDVTAFLFYITHEMNRNQSKIHNFLYRALPVVPISLIIMVPLISVFLGSALRGVVINPEQLFLLVMSLAFVHYYLESIMWKRDTPHRQHILVK